MKKENWVLMKSFPICCTKNTWVESYDVHITLPKKSCRLGIFSLRCIKFKFQNEIVLQKGDIVSDKSANNLNQMCLKGIQLNRSNIKYTWCQRLWIHAPEGPGKKIIIQQDISGKTFYYPNKIFRTVNSGRFA